MSLLLLTISFLIVCLASHTIGKWFSRIKLPYITGYLFAGGLAGAFGLDLISLEQAEQLRFIDEISLGVIAFIAGSELYLKDLRSRLRTIAWTTGGILVGAMICLGVALYLLTSQLPFAADLSTSGRVAVALLGSTVLLALSPPSTIAVIREVQARGPFTSTALSVTVLMDVTIIVLFAITASLAGTLLLGESFNIGFMAVLALDLFLAVTLGYVAGQLLRFVLGLPIPRLIQALIVILLGFLIFELASFVKADSLTRFGFEIYIEPLLIALVAGFFVTNFTNFRDLFDDILHDIGPAVYVAFFTLTGIGLKLDILIATLPIAFTLFFVRMAGIFIGSYVGTTVAGAPKEHRPLSWMAYITQAGIALGLAREISVQFPDLGASFATLIIAVVVLNEVFGPLFLKAALKRTGEAKTETPVAPQQSRDAVIFGISAASVALARQLQEYSWNIRLADTNLSTLERFESDDLSLHLINNLDTDVLLLLSEATDALVVLLDDDEANLLVCTLGRSTYQVPRLIVRPNDLKSVTSFKELGAMVVDASSAWINLLDQAVRSPQTAALMLHQDENREVVQITISNPAYDGRYIRELRLPSDVLLLSILRGTTPIVPHGNSVLRLRDELTVLGSPDSIDEVTLTLGY